MTHKLLQGDVLDKLRELFKGGDCMTWKVLQGDVCEKLAELPGESVQTVVTSPPY